MDPKYLTGIDEIDAHHTEIEEIAQAVIEAVAAKDKWHIVHYILVRLYELLRFHFGFVSGIRGRVGIFLMRDYVLALRRSLGRCPRPRTRREAAAGDDEPITGNCPERQYPPGSQGAFAA